jgi:NAD(P)-dependent dehydrogenase (short-subunit alcohol dehydrogenase family)
MNLSGKVALLTGAASGIGAASAEAFAHAGADLVLADVNAAAGGKLADRIREAGRKALFVTADVSRADDVDRLVQQALTHFKRIDILMNNAGTWVPGTVVTLDEAEWDRVINTNLKSVFLVSKQVVPVMKAQGGGAIINVASVAGLVGATDACAYVASKGGVVNLTRGMALDFAPFRIRVNALCPGMTDTPMGDRVVGYYKPGADPKASKATWQPLERVGTPADMAAMAVFLASDDAAFATGAMFVVDGGLTAQ